MLEDIKVPWVILGHSERRQLLKESEEVTNLSTLYQVCLWMHTASSAVHIAAVVCIVGVTATLYLAVASPLVWQVLS